jgi:peptidyl-tRNA hydrolase
VTRQDLSAGYQIAQTGHAIAEYAYERRRTFRRWRKRSGYLISLAVKDLNELENLMKVLDKHKLDYVKFFEPDVNEVTAITISPHKLADYILKYIPLAGKKFGVFDKNYKKNE